MITHHDSDGVLALATLWRWLGPDREVVPFYTSPPKLLRTLCASVIYQDGRDVDGALEQLVILDLTANPRAVAGAAMFTGAHWYDHHPWPSDIDAYVPDTVTLVVDPRRKSATHVLAERLGVECFVAIANEIDTNAVETPLAERMRAIVGAIRYHLDGEDRESAFTRFAHALARGGTAAIGNTDYEPMLEGYRGWIEHHDSRALSDIVAYDRAGLRIGVLESDEAMPVFAIFHTLTEHDAAPFDILVFVIRHEDPAATKFEFRTQSDTDVSKVARAFGGGGHKPASGAFVPHVVTVETLLERIEAIYD